MRIGVRGHDFGKHTPEALAEKIASLGAEAVQLAIPKAIAGVDRYGPVDLALARRVRQAFAGHGVAIAVLGCYVEPALPDPAERAQQIVLFRQGVAWAAAVGAETIATETTACTEGDRPEAFRHLAGSLAQMLDAAEAQGLTLLVEPVAAHTLHTPEKTEELLRLFPGRALGVIFDPVNLLTPETVENQEALWGHCFRCFGGHIRALHVKDALLSGGRLVDCPLGQGQMDYGPIARRLGGQPLAALREGVTPGREAAEFVMMRTLLEACENFSNGRIHAQAEGE
jgi:sugar phosphate isomerase/epimerase